MQVVYAMAHFMSERQNNARLKALRAGEHFSLGVGWRSVIRWSLNALFRDREFRWTSGSQAVVLSLPTLGLQAMADRMTVLGLLAAAANMFIRASKTRAAARLVHVRGITAREWDRLVLYVKDMMGATTHQMEQEAKKSSKEAVEAKLERGRKKGKGGHAKESKRGDKKMTREEVAMMEEDAAIARELQAIFAAEAEAERERGERRQKRRLDPHAGPSGVGRRDESESPPRRPDPLGRGKGRA